MGKHFSARMEEDLASGHGAVRDTPTPLGIRYSFTGDGEPAKLSIVLGGQFESKQRE